MKELKDIPKHNPFKVPEKYFEDLEGRILKATTGAKVLKARKGVIRRVLPYLAAAASVALLALLGYSFFYGGPDGDRAELVTEATVNELTEGYLNDIDLYTLEDRVAGSGSFLERSGAEESDIIDYLISENIDVSDIYEIL